MASLNRTCTETHPAPYPRHDPVNGYDPETLSASDTSCEHVSWIPDKKEAGSTCHRAPGQVVRRGMRLYFHHAVAKCKTDGSPESSANCSGMPHAVP